MLDAERGHQVVLQVGEHRERQILQVGVALAPRQVDVFVVGADAQHARVALLEVPVALAGKRNRDFEERDARVLGVSTDNEYVHLAWRKSHPDLKDLPFPMLSDLKHDLVTALGIKHPGEGVAMRATYIVDPENIIRFVS